ncbi:caspase-6-like isoform 2-T2 [Pholidichthys leucotaenia]
MSATGLDCGEAGIATDSRIQKHNIMDIDGDTITNSDGFIRSSLDLDPAEEYKMGRKTRGMALIFNHESFDFRLNLKHRRGTNNDLVNLEERLKQLNFDVFCFNNKNKEEVLNEISQAAKSDHSDADCFFLAFLSHGEKDYVYAYDGEISIKDITAMFKGTECKSLVGKPKIFVLQACRGDVHDDAVQECLVTDTMTEGEQVEVDASALYTLPAGADFVMCYSVAEGYFSYRNPISGSWYIQDLCEALQRYGESLEFAELLTLVNRKVSRRSVDKCADKRVIGKKQMPCFTSMLTKKLYFRPPK